ncbi:G protein-coupled receptor [Reticulomyxa filosa]|uniref:G protein-coupled receptor n=1 Tax=Reticulomyxa filosa TaxID=46433 RepID=X6N163_RETFI|nr:G protein-coupled receptor [Reticulomyxa filosa]|eukprot:ETO19653.1 G protein-coupled receptor [Reticulomyxa filosa]
MCVHENMCVKRYPSQYISMLSSGENSSGLITSILIWIQQLGTSSLRYSVGVYFILLSPIFISTLIGVSLLYRYLKQGYFADQMDWISISTAYNDSGFKGYENDSTIAKLSQNESSRIGTPSNPFAIAQAMRPTESGTEDTLALSLTLMDDTSRETKLEILSNTAFQSDAQQSNQKMSQSLCLVMLGILSGIQNGMLASIGSYALLPYGNKVYVTSYTTSNLVSPLMAFATAYFPGFFVKKVFIITAFAGMCITSAYILLQAWLSPTPWLMANGTGGIIVTIVYVSCIICITLCKTSIILLVKNYYNLEKERLVSQIDIVKSKHNELLMQSFQRKIESHLQLCEVELHKSMERIGIIIQVGSFFGAILFFLLVVVLDCFKEN